MKDTLPFEFFGAKTFDQVTLTLQLHCSNCYSNLRPVGKFAKHLRDLSRIEAEYEVNVCLAVDTYISDAMTLSITIFSQTTFSITTLSITLYNRDTQHNIP
jgi:hypothetical protein